MSEWKKAAGTGLSRGVRWTSEPQSEADKSVYVGAEIQGVYTDKRENIGQYLSNVYEIKTKEHGLLGVWGNAVLDSLFEEIPVGSEVKITHLGRQAPKKPGGKPYHIFNVDYRETPLISAGATGEDLPEM